MRNSSHLADVIGKFSDDIFDLPNYCLTASSSSVERYSVLTGTYEPLTTNSPISRPGDLLVYRQSGTVVI